jgi:hypothetical protein
MFSQNVGNKLRTYNKLFQEVFETEMYLSKNISSRYRSAFDKFRNRYINLSSSDRILTCTILLLTSLNKFSRKSAV